MACILLGVRSRVVRDIADLTRQPRRPRSSASARTSSPGRSSASRRTPGKEELTREVARAAYERGARWVDVFTLRPVGQAAAARPRRRVDPRLRAAVDGRPARVAVGRARGADHADRERGAGGARRASTPARAGRDVLPYLPNVGDVINRATTNWMRRAGADRRDGRGSSTRTSTRRGARAAVGRDRPRLPARRGRSRGGVARARRQAAGRGDAADRAPVRPHPAPRPGDGRDGRPHGVVGLARGRLRDRRRHPPLPERAERGDLHHPRPAARRRSRHGNAAARGLRRDDGRDPRRVRGRARREDRRRPRRRRPARRWQPRTTARRGSASSRSSTARAGSARSTPSSTRRSSTRTPRATSRSGTPTSSASSRRGRQAAASMRAASTSTS